MARSLTTARPCARRGCGRTTTDPTGACHDHRGSSYTAVPVYTVTGRKPAPAGTPVVDPTEFLPPGYREQRGPERDSRTFVYENEAGQLHRLDGPARITYQGGVLYSEDRWIDGRQPDSEDEPWRVVYHRNGAVKKEIYGSREYMHHRENGPAVITYSTTGTKLSEEWKRQNNVSRFGGPARTEFDPVTGAVVFEEWRQDSAHHRVDGPAVIDLRSGQRKEEWHAYGSQLFTAEDLVSTLRGRTRPFLEKEWAKHYPGDPVPESNEEIAIRIALPAYRSVRLGGGVAPADIPDDTLVTALLGGVKTREGIREVANGAPVEWVRSFEETRA